MTLKAHSRRSATFLLALFSGGVCVAAEVRVGQDQRHKTISSALHVLQDGDTCLIDAGIYRERIDIQQDNVTLVGNGEVIITGCDVVDGMEPCQINGVDGMRVEYRGPVYDVFCGRQYLTPARYPNKTAAMTSNEDWEGTFIHPDTTIAFDSLPNRFSSEIADGYYVGMHGSFEWWPRNKALSSWCSISVPILGVDAQGKLRVDDSKASSGFMGDKGLGNGLGYIIGARAVLDTPGEWYSDGNEVVVIPPKGVENVDATYELRTRMDGAVIDGSGVRLEGIRFRGATAQVRGNDVSFIDCSFAHLSPFRHSPNPVNEPRNRQSQSRFSSWGTPENGTAGIYVSGDKFVAKNCHLSKSWWCGMMIRGNDATVENCLIEDVNWMARRSAGIFSWGDRNVIRYCTIRNVGGAAIEGGNQNWVRQYSKENIWEYNYLENACQLVVDQGFFYVNHQLGSNPMAKSIWRYNVGKGSRGPTKGDWTHTAVAYYIDGNSSGYFVHNNIAIDVNEAIHYNDTREGDDAGKNVLFANNTFFNCEEVKIGIWAIGDTKRPEPDAGLMLINNASAPASSLDFEKKGKLFGWQNNVQSLPATAFQNPDDLDFTPVVPSLTAGGAPVLGAPVSYIGAVDPKKGMWRFGVDETKLPTGSALERIAD